MRPLVALAVVAIATVSSPSHVMVDAMDTFNNENENDKRNRRREFLRRAQTAPLAPSDPIPEGLLAPAHPVPDFLNDENGDSDKGEKQAVMAPPDPFPKELKGKKIAIMAPGDSMPDHLAKEKIAILAPADPVPGKKKTKECVLMEAVYLFAEGFEPKDGEEERHEWKCEFHEWDNAILLLRGLPDSFYEDHSDRIKSGETVLTMTYDETMEDREFDPEGTDVFWVPEGSTLELSYALDEDEEGFRQRRRAAIKPEGDHTLLVFRVSDKFGSRPDRSAKQLSDDIFGTGKDLHNLKSQYAACSGGLLNFLPAKGENITDGVAELEIPVSMRFQSSSIVENWVTKLGPREVGPLDQWTLVMFVLPNTVNFAGAAAYTYVGSRHSVFLDQFSDNLLVLMHEIGHNLGNRHSGQGTLSYDDGTCMMGAHVYEDEAPRMCFNGAKSWYFGWYDDRHEKVDPTLRPWRGQLVGVDDYLKHKIKTDGSQTVVARVISHTSADLFIMFNRKKGVNSQVHEKGDLVTVVEQDGEDGQSWLLAGLSEKTVPFRYPNWNKGRADLVIEVCDRIFGSPDFATVMVYLDYGTNIPSCPGRKSSPKDLTASNVSPESGTVSVEIPMLSNQNMYREKSDGSIRKSSEVQNLFGPNWNLQAYRFETNTKWSIPGGVHIESAVLLVKPYEQLKYLKRSMNGNVKGHAVGNAPPNGNSFNFISNAPKTKATVKINPSLPKWDPTTYEELVDVTPIVQELVDQTDYKEGNALEVFLMGDSPTTGRRIKTPQAGAGPVLQVAYRRPGGGAAGDDKKVKEDSRVQDIELVVQHSTDDYVETTKGSLRANSKAHDLWTPTFEKHACRFQGVPIPQGAKILEASLEFFGKSKVTMNAPISGTIQGENIGNSPPFKYKTFQLTNAPKTAAAVKVEKLPKWRAGAYNKIGDVAPIIQEIVNRRDYSAGNAIKLILSNRGSTSSRKIRTFESGRGAKLVIRFQA